MYRRHSIATHRRAPRSIPQPFVSPTTYLRHKQYFIMRMFLFMSCWAYLVAVEAVSIDHVRSARRADAAVNTWAEFSASSVGQEEGNLQCTTKPPKEECHQKLEQVC